MCICEVLTAVVFLLDIFGSCLIGPVVISGRVPTLFSRDVQVAVLSSGSKGNCTYIGDSRTGVLIDCGRMSAAGLDNAPIDAVLVTHEHSDHAGSCRILCNRLEKMYGRTVPFHMTPGTAAALKPQVIPSHLETIEAGKAFRVGHLVVDPFRIPHDTSDPVAFRVGIGERWVGVVTDLGRPTTLVSQKLKSLSVAVLEFNHDIDMLLDGPYAWSVKQRIRSSHGHLSNEQAGTLLSESVGDNLEHLVLAHLSADNNAPDKALLQASMALHKAGASKRVHVQVAQQDQPLDPIGIGVQDW
jgi:phosphoribosyl 1,2-cyclic phosphodiesterase